MAEEDPMSRFYATFERRQEFIGMQQTLLNVDLGTEPSSEEERYEASLLEQLSVIV
jgi:hypothetical protein